jgi:hypothetical protein
MTNLTYCPNFSALVVKDTTEQLIPVVRARCGMWTCEFCAEKNRSIWRARLINHIMKNLDREWAWFTLTAHSKARGAFRSITNLRNAWDKLVKRMKRKYGDFDYVRIFERHADGSYHIHCIASIYFDDIYYRVTRNGKKAGLPVPYSLWLKYNAIELSTGMYTHAENFASKFNDIAQIKHKVSGKSKADVEQTELEIKAMQAGLVASYITKYVTKIEPEFKTEIGRVRHIQTSQKWLRPEKLEDAEKWIFKHGIYYDDVVAAIRTNQAYSDGSAQHIVTLDDFINTYIYPSEFGETKNDV